MFSLSEDIRLGDFTAFRLFSLFEASSTSVLIANTSILAIEWASIVSPAFFEFNFLHAVSL